MARLDHADPGKNSALMATYERIAKTRGSVSNILKTFSHAPEGLERFAALGEYVRYGTALKPRVRELSILTVARGIQYAWTHHVPPALKAGVTEAELAMLNSGALPGTLDTAERTAIAFTREFVNGGRVSEPTFNDSLKVFSKREITELTLLCGYFIALGFTANAFEVDLEADRKPLMK
jgi:4-carboxymuconolactone decarboxylase